MVRILSFSLGALVAAAAIYGLALGGKFAGAGAAVGAFAERMSASAGFAVSQVVVLGRHATRRDDILRALDVSLGRSLLAFDCGAARERLIALDWVDDASVRRVLPGTIEISIVEKVPLAIWQHDGRLLLIDRKGQTIAPVSAEDLERYPHVVGTGAEKNAAALLDVLSRFPELESRVRAAVRVGDRRWDLALQNGIKIALPAEDMEEALRELMIMDREQSLLSRDIVAVDLRFKDRFILRMPAGSMEVPAGPSRET